MNLNGNEMEREQIGTGTRTDKNGDRMAMNENKRGTKEVPIE